MHTGHWPWSTVAAFSAPQPRTAALTWWATAADQEVTGPGPLGRFIHARAAAMTQPILTRQRTPLDGVPGAVFSDLSAFVRRFAPRWLDESRSHCRLTMRRARERERARGRRRGYRLVAAPTRAAPVRSVRHLHPR